MRYDLNVCLRLISNHNSTQLHVMSKHHRRSLESVANTSFLGSQTAKTDRGLPLKRYLLEETQSIDFEISSLIMTAGDSSSLMEGAATPLGEPRVNDSYAGTSAPLLDGHASYTDGSPSTENATNNNGTIVLCQGGSQERPQYPHSEQNGAAAQSASNTRATEKENIVVEILQHSDSSRDFVWRCIKHVCRGDKRWLGVIVVIIFVLIIVFVAWTIVGIISANIASDRTGLSSSQHCGIWQFDDNAGDDAAYRDDLYNRQKEERASQYARNCYSNPHAADSLSCKIFYNQSIDFETKTQQHCPFPSPELCFDGLYSAISFDTGLVDGSLIGINSDPTYRFRRRTTCSPLNMSEPYISRHSEDKEDNMYYYNYGSLDDTDFTFNTSGYPFDWLVPVYSAK